MGRVIADLSQCLVRILNDRRAFIRAHRSDPLTHISDHAGVGDDNLLRLVRSQIIKFLQHFLRGPQIQRGLLIRIREALSRHQDPPVYLVLRVQKMHVTGGADRFAKGLSHLYDPPVYIL